MTIACNPIVAAGLRSLRRLVRPLLRWHWHDGPQEWRLQLTRWGRTRATVWTNSVWHTWDANGTGGENSSERNITTAKHEAYYSLIKQGWL